MKTTIYLYKRYISKELDKYGRFHDSTNDDIWAELDKRCIDVGYFRESGPEGKVERYLWYDKDSIIKGV